MLRLKGPLLSNELNILCFLKESWHMSPSHAKFGYTASYNCVNFTWSLSCYVRINTKLHGEKIKCHPKTNGEQDCLADYSLLTLVCGYWPSCVTLRKLLKLPVSQSLHKTRTNTDTYFMKLSWYSMSKICVKQLEWSQSYNCSINVS